VQVAATASAPATSAGAIAVIGSAAGRRPVRDALGNGRGLIACAHPEDLDAGVEIDVAVLCAEDGAGPPEEMLRAFRERFAQVPVVVVVGALESRGIRAALAAGASGLVAGELLEEMLEPCLEAVVAGHVCVPREHWRQVRPPVLSTREKQVLGLLVLGYMNSQIAEHLFLAESTVKSHLHSAFGKLGVRSRNEAVNAILDPQRGLGLGILGVGAEPLPVSQEPVG
jgi:DNA-binding NarL/FixJ family response regulator